MAHTEYDRIPYEAGAFAATAPASMAFVARAHGAAAPSLDGAVRVLELGCGDGRNLLPLAHYHRGWSLRGVDLSERAIDRARAAARAIGLENVHFEHADVGQLEIDAPYDFVIAHGLYSWVSPATRAAVRALIARTLAERGLGYVSFNAQPGWGVRGRVRDTLLHLTPRDLDGSRALVSALSEVVAEPENHWEQLVAHELDKVRRAGDGYLAHEYLAPHNDAFWLGEVVRDFREAGLSYAGDALFDRPEGWVHPSRRAAVAPLSDDAIRQAELLDLVHYRQLRGALFAKQMPGPAPDLALIDECYIAAVVARRNDPFDLERGVEEPFDGPNSTVVLADRPLAKMALLLLADRYPEGFRFDDLVARCRARLDELDIAEEPEDVPALRSSLATLFDHLALELRVHAPTLRTVAGARPTASALSRWEARHGTVLTTALHTGVPLEPIDRAIVEELDGTKTAEEIARAVAEAAASGALALEGAPHGIERMTAFSRERVDQLLTLLGWWGLVG